MRVVEPAATGGQGADGDGRSSLDPRRGDAADERSLEGEEQGQHGEGDQVLARGDVNVTAAELRANVTAAYLEALTTQEHVALAKESSVRQVSLLMPLVVALLLARSPR